MKIKITLLIICILFVVGCQSRNLHSSSIIESKPTYYGEMFFYDEDGLAGSFNGTYQALFMNNSYHLQGFTLEDSALVCQQCNGHYLVVWQAIGEGVNNHEYDGVIFVDEEIKGGTISHTIGTALNEIIMSGSGIIEINDQQRVTLRVIDETSSGNGQEILARVTLARI